jgi:hypothetical protein
MEKTSLILLALAECLASAGNMLLFMLSMSLKHVEVI